MAYRMCSLCGTPYKDERGGSGGSARSPQAGPWAESDADRHSDTDCLDNCERRYAHATRALVDATRSVERARERVRRAS